MYRRGIKISHKCWRPRQLTSGAMLEGRGPHGSRGRAGLRNTRLPFLALSSLHKCLFIFLPHPVKHSERTSAEGVSPTGFVPGLDATAGQHCRGLAWRGLGALPLAFRRPYIHLRNNTFFCRLRLRLINVASLLAGERLRRGERSAGTRQAQGRTREGLARPAKGLKAEERSARSQERSAKGEEWSARECERGR